MDNPIVLLREEAALLRRLAAQANTLPGNVLRGLIVGEAARRGVLETDQVQETKEQKQEVSEHAG